MIQSIPPEITIGSFSVIGVLTGYIWNTQSKRIDELKKKQNDRPCSQICVYIEAIKTDISWIKKELKKYKHGMIKKLAESFGVCNQTIHDIKTGRNWKNITVLEGI